MAVRLTIAAVAETMTVRAENPAADVSRTTLGRTFATRDIDELPVAARDFNSLALLTPGILVDHSTGRNPDLTISASEQIGRNNTALIDALTDDDHLGGLMRSGVSLDAVKEFVVATHNFNAEYGQASGVIVSVLTRSGTNRPAGRAYYFHRDDRWDATDGAARLAVPPADKTEFEAKVVGGFGGGPLVRNRAFYFGSAEYHHARHRSRCHIECVADVPAQRVADRAGALSRAPAPRAVLTSTCIRETS